MPAAAKPATLAAALVAAQAAMPAVDKDATNPHFRSKFTSLDHLIALTRPVLNAHGLAIRQSPTFFDGVHSLTTTMVHESGEQSQSTMALILGKNDMQGLGAALTYARRYAWASACGIASEEDDDGNSASARGVSEAAPPKAAGSADPAAASFPDREKRLMELVAEKGGGVEKTAAGLETARGRGADTLDKWLNTALKHWEAAEKPSEFATKASDAIAGRAAA